VGIGNNFLNITQMAQQLRERIDKWDYIKLKSFCTTTIKKVTILKRPLTEWEKIIASYISDKQLKTRIYREHKELNSKKKKKKSMPSEEMGK
jgi:hypothetical protein